MTDDDQILVCKLGSGEVLMALKKEWLHSQGDSFMVVMPSPVADLLADELRGVLGPAEQGSVIQLVRDELSDECKCCSCGRLMPASEACASDDPDVPIPLCEDCCLKAP